MRRSLDRAIREHLAADVAGRAFLEAFGGWFVPATRDVERTEGQATIDLTYEIVLCLAEYSNGDCNEAALKDVLRPLIVQLAPQSVPA